MASQQQESVSGNGSVADSADGLVARFASLKLAACPHLSPADDAETQQLVGSLRRLKNRGGRKANIRSTDHCVVLGRGAGPASAAIVEEAADDDDDDDDAADDDDDLNGDGDGDGHKEIGAANAQQAKTKSNGAAGTAVLTSWKTQEFAYRKTTKIGYSEADELPTLARGLFTSAVGGGAGAQDTQRIVVRGYDKFFNEGEMPWTKPQAIETFSTPPYELSFKENGCIIFVAALTEKQLIVTSKHSLGASNADRPTHAQKGEEWLHKHLASVGRNKAELAAELWKRNETAVAELCDDSFEEHVLAYPAERTGLHLHGLNANKPQFSTRSMGEVEAFAKQWGMLPTRYIEIDSLTDVDRFCHKVAESGSWQGIPIEGFVVRTRIPSVPAGSQGDGESRAVAPPYQPGQVWFYKVKFDEPYLMYRDWRELTRRMLTDKQKYDKARKDSGRYNAASMPAQIGKIELSALEDAVPGAPHSSEPKSKNQLKKEARKAEITRLAKEEERRAAEAAAGLAPPDPPQSRSKRPETKLFVQWCHEMLYGSNDGKAKPQPALFAGFSQSQGIIHLRERFIQYMQSSEGQKRLAEFAGPKRGTVPSEGQDKAGQRDKQDFTKTLIVPIAVPGCGKTALALALRHLFPDLGHTQSDDVTAKRTAPTFLKNILKELELHSVVFADRNNHLFKHRNEITESVRDWEAKSDQAPGENKHAVRLVALAWSLDALPLNAIHHICSDRITMRGENHQSLRLTADREHEHVLWQFLRNLEPFGAAEHGAGDQGYGDEQFHSIVKMDVNASLEQNITKALKELASVIDIAIPTKKHIDEAISAVKQYKVSTKKEIKGAPTQPVRYYALSIELDVKGTLPKLLEGDSAAAAAFARLDEGMRVNNAPHVTLVHSIELRNGEAAKDDAEDQTRASAQKRWDTYAKLSKADVPMLCDVTIDLVAWDGRAMALGVSHVQSSTLDALQQLQGTQWRPHITLGTFANDIRPYEGNRVLRDADACRPQVHSYRFVQPLHITGRLKGYSQ